MPLADREHAVNYYTCDLLGRTAHVCVKIACPSTALCSLDSRGPLAVLFTHAERSLINPTIKRKVTRETLSQRLV